MVEQLERPAMTFVMDVREEAAHDAMVAACAERLGSVDVLVASAGINGRQGTNSRQPNAPPGIDRLMTMPAEVMHDLLQVNLLGALFSNRAAARRMIAQARGGSIVNITSTGSRLPIPGSFYGATKAGVTHLTKVLALELAEHGIRVNAVAPGYIDTLMTSGSVNDPARRAATVANVPMQRFGRPEEVANAALFLACDEGSFFTGEQLYAAGGLFVG
jgi:NAD(P)-dependent dehydrogenase (short-subunit alcohol dehydrogenase family)